MTKRSTRSITMSICRKKSERKSDVSISVQTFSEEKVLSQKQESDLLKAFNTILKFIQKNKNILIRVFSHKAFGALCVVGFILFIVVQLRL